MADLATAPNTLGGSHFNTILDIQYRDWRSIITVSDANSGQQLYVSTTNQPRDGLVITNASGRVIGTSKIHSMSSKIEVETTTEGGISHAFEVHNDKGIIGSPAYTSPAFDGHEMTWKNKAMSTKIIYTLMEGKGLAFARFESNSKTKIGRLEIMNNVTQQDQFDEIAVTILTLLRRKLLSIETANYVAIVS